VLMITMSKKMEKCMVYIPGSDISCPNHNVIEDTKTWIALTETVSFTMFILSTCFGIDT
jgi:hypothetical protein